MDEEGMAGVLKEVKDWGAIDLSQISQEDIDSWEDLIHNFFMKHTMRELHEEAQKRFIFLSPCYTPKEIAEDEQLASRNYWVDVEHPEWGTTLRYLGAPCKLSLTPWKIYRRAPLVGEHNDEVYKEELGLSDDDLAVLKRTNVV